MHCFFFCFFNNRDESDTDYDELSDGEISKLLIVTQTPARPKKHEGFDRTGDFTSRAQMSQDLASAINDGLFYYEQDLWEELYEHGYDDEEDDSWVSGTNTPLGVIHKSRDCIFAYFRTLPPPFAIVFTT